MLGNHDGCPYSGSMPVGVGFPNTLGKVGFLPRSLFTHLLDLYGISIALAIHFLDHSQVTLDIALLWSADARSNRVLLTFHSAGVKTRPRRNTFTASHRAKNECVPLMDCDRKLTVCGTNMLLAERIIPTGIMARSQETLDIAGISIAVAIHSLDPLECRRREESCTIDISLRWSENQTTKEHFYGQS